MCLNSFEIYGDQFTTCFLYQLLATVGDKSQNNGPIKQIVSRLYLTVRWFVGSLYYIDNKPIFKYIFTPPFQFKPLVVWKGESSSKFQSGVDGFN